VTLWEIVALVALVALSVAKGVGLYLALSSVIELQAQRETRRRQHRSWGRR
jgi:hypothetical protein